MGIFSSIPKVSTNVRVDRARGVSKMKTCWIAIVIGILLTVLLFAVSCTNANSTKDKLSGFHDQLVTTYNYLDDIKGGISVALNESDVEKEPKFFVSVLYKASNDFDGVLECLGEVRSEVGNIIADPKSNIIKDKLPDVYDRIAVISNNLRDIKRGMSIVLHESDVEKDPKFFVIALDKVSNDIDGVLESLGEVRSEVDDIIASQ